MKTFLKQISATLLSLVVLFSSMSFTIDKHYCGETLVDMSIFGQAENCGMEEMEIDPDAKRIKKKKCCKDETIIVESPTFDKEKIIFLQAIDIDFVFSYAFSYINLYQDIAIAEEFYKDFSPPDVELNILALHQVFLI